MSFASTTVQRLNGVPTLFVEGRPLQGMTATSCAFDDPQVIRDFVSSGVEILMIWIEAGIHCWKAPGVYDWSYAEKKLGLFERNAGSTRWLIRIRLGLLARWWAHAHPAEVHNPPGAEGPGAPEPALAVANIVSPVWLGETTRMVADFVKWLEGTRWANRIIGFMLNAGSTEEWLLFDTAETVRGNYHPVYTREFRAWLRTKYHGSEAELQAAWRGADPGNVLGPREPPPTFDTARCPQGHIRKGSHIWGPYSLRDPREDQAAIDYYTFLNTTLADALVAFCRAAKEAASVPVVCGGFHSYLWWEQGGYSYIQEYGHGLVQRLNESPWVDFVSDIASYDARYAGGPSGYLGLPACLNLHGKLHYTEVDLCTVSDLEPAWREAWRNADTSAIPPRASEPVIPERVWNWNHNYCGRDEAEQLAIFQREHAHNLITGTPYWWFDIRRNNYREPWMVEGLAKLAAIGRDAIHRDRSSIAQVAFVCSEDTPLRQASMSGELLRFELESCHPLLLDVAGRKWGLAGVPFDTYELHDLAHPGFPGGQYRLLVFVNCACIPPDAAAGVKRWQNGGRTLLWTYAADVYARPSLGDLAPGEEELVGMRLGWRNRRQNIHVDVARGTGPFAAFTPAHSFGTEGSIGPVFFADDPEAATLGTLRDGGEPAFALRDHGSWRSLYLAMHCFDAALLREIARFAGAHVWCERDEVVYANRSMLCLHTATNGPRTLALPAPAVVTDLWTGESSGRPVSSIDSSDPRYRTRIWRTDYAG
ncbi:MAG: hypothetical protein ACOX5G_11450 [Kiritimatiellia bacterium]|jgi:hypothetical protein